LLGLLLSLAGPEGAGRAAVRRVRLAVPLACLGSGVLLLGLHVGTTRLSPTHPQPDHLTYWLDADRSVASWLSLDGAPDPWTRRYLGDQPAKRRLSDYLPTKPERTALVAGAPVVSLPPPRAEVLQDRISGQDRIVQLRLSSPRRAQALRLFITSAVQVREAIVGDTVLRYPTSPQSWWLKASTVPPSGVEVTLTVRRGQALSLLLVDTSPGLQAAGGPVAPRPPSLLGYFEPVMPEDSSTFVARRISLEGGA
jgi:hypothetical protein